MVGFGKTPDEKFKGIQELGYDGMELNSPGGLNKAACLAGSKKYNFPIHGMVDSAHWKTPLSHPSDVNVTVHFKTSSPPSMTQLCVVAMPY